MQSPNSPVSAAGKVEYARRINLALRFVEEHFAEDIGLKEIADAACFSPFHFHRIFSAIQAEGPVDYLRRLRLEKAAVLLAIKPDQTITSIALETGFSSSSAFARAFLERFGIPARAYRIKSSRKAGKDRIPSEREGKPRRRIPSGWKKRSAGRYAFVGMRRMPALRLACVRSMSGYGPAINKAWRTLFAWAYPRGIVGPAARMYGIPLDDPEVTPEKKCRYFAALSVGPEVVPDGPVEIRIIEPCWCAEFSFEGGIEDFSRFYDWVYGEWLPKNGFLPDDKSSLEEYAPEPFVSASDTSKDRIFRFSFLLSVRSL
jgi:AraC family transcriptional regulator